jgi:ribosomal protein S11
VVGVAHVAATFNNTIVTITDPQGNSHRLVVRLA